MELFDEKAKEYSSNLNITYETIKQISRSDFEKCFIDGAIYGYAIAMNKKENIDNSIVEYLIKIAKIIKRDEADEAINKIINNGLH